MASPRSAEADLDGPLGDPARHLALVEIEAGLDALAPPRDRGRVALLVARGEDRSRSTPQRAHLSAEGGMPGDAWLRDAPDKIVSQITVMQIDVGRLIANGQELTLFGDNLVVDLDLSEENLPTGSRLRIGTALVEVTPEPHNGCRKYRQRFGADALRAISTPARRASRLRGIHVRVIEDGEVGVDDPIEVLGRAPSQEGEPS